MRIIIEGAGEIGSHLAKMLRAEANDVIIIDNDEERLSRISQLADVEVINGNPSSPQVLREAGVNSADLFIAVYPFIKQEVNIVGAVLAKRLGAAKVIARIEDEEFLTAENKLLFKELGIELMFYPERIAADEIVEHLKRSFISETMDFARGKLQIAVFKIDENSPLLDLKLSECEFDRGMFRIIAITRESKTVIPEESTKFQYGDLVFAISKRESIDAMSEFFGMSKMPVQKAMIMGGSEMAAMVAASLARLNIKVKLVERRKEKCIELIERLPDNVSIVCGDGRNSDFLFEEGITESDAFIALTGNDEANVLACVVAKKLGVPRTLAEVENIEYLHLAEGMGVDCAINKKLISAGRIFKFTLSGKARFVKYLGGSDAEVMEYTVAQGSAITKGPLKDIGFTTKAIICGVIRGNEAFIANDQTVIEPYDRVAVFALPQSIREVDKFFKA